MEEKKIVCTHQYKGLRECLRMGFQNIKLTGL